MLAWSALSSLSCQNQEPENPFASKRIQQSFFIACLDVLFCICKKLILFIALFVLARTSPTVVTAHNGFAIASKGSKKR